MHTLTVSLSTPVTLAACLLALPALHAQTNDPSLLSTNLPPIIVQASRTGRTASEMPANVQVITAEEIARAGHQNVMDVLQKQAAVPIKNFSGNPATATVALRGFGENSHGRVLILLNGERLNNPDMSAPNLMRIPVQAIKRIEVIRGPQTVLYGDYAEAGVINIITDTSIDAKPVTTISASAGSYDAYSLHLSKAGTFEDGVSYFAGADWNKIGGYRDNGDYESWNLNASVSKDWDGGQNVSLSTFYHDSEYGLPGALTWQQFKDNPQQTLSPNDRAWFETWGFNLGGGSPVGDNGNLDANLSVSRRETESRWLTPNSASYYNTDIDTYSFTPRYVNDREIAGHANILTVGSDLHYDTSTIDSHGSGSYYGYPYAYANRWDFDRTSLGGYGKDEFFLTETLSLALGARAEYINNRIVKGRSTTSDSDAEKAYDAALLYRPSDQVKVFTRVARYYHAPFIDEIFPGSGVPNTDLVPETGYDYEVGTEVAINKEWTVGLTAYELDANNEIYFDPKAKGYGANVNSPDDTRRRGIESSLRWKREQAGSFGVNYDYTDSAFTEGLYEGNTVPLVPEHMLTVQGEVCLTPELAALATVSYVSSQHSGSDFANAKDKLDDYGTLDLAVRYEPAFLKGLNVIAGVDNVFDREYAYSSFYGTTYYPATDRTWKLCASYSF